MRVFFCALQLHGSSKSAQTYKTGLRLQQDCRGIAEQVIDNVRDCRIAGIAE